MLFSIGWCFAGMSANFIFFGLMKGILFSLLLLPLCLNAQIITTVAEHGVAGYSGRGSSGNGGFIATTECAAFDRLVSICGDGGNKRVRKISASGVYYYYLPAMVWQGLRGITGLPLLHRYRR